MGAYAYPRHSVRAPRPDTAVHSLGRHHVLLVDNLGLALCLVNGRANSPELAPVCRTFSALSLASGGPRPRGDVARLLQVAENQVLVVQERLALPGSVLVTGGTLLKLE